MEASPDYSYGANNPLSFVDPNGEWPLDVAFLTMSVATFVRTPSMFNAGMVLVDAVSVVNPAGSLSLLVRSFKYSKILGKFVGATRKVDGIAFKMNLQLFAKGTGKLSDEAIDFSVSSQKRLQHAYKHASDLGFGNWNKQNAGLWKDYITDTLKNTTKTFDNKLGNDAVQGFYRVVDGNDVAVYIYKEGANKGLVASVVKLSENQLVKFGLK